VNKDYSAVLATSRGVHERTHEGAAVVHLYAAGAWEAQGNLDEAKLEMETLLKEDPLSESGDKYRQILEKMEAEQARRADAKLHPALAAKAPSQPSPEEIARRNQFAAQQDREAGQIAEAEAAANPACLDCDTAGPVESLPAGSVSGLTQPGHRASGATFRVAVNEVSVFFAATDHGRSVTDLSASDVEIRDDQQPPSAILGFRNESQLPLRLGLVIDTSDSVNSRFAFEQAAVARFLEKVLGNKDDLAFVVGVNASVLLVQDFTSDQQLTAHAVGELAPKGGTAVWDAVAFAADKLASHPEDQPVARIVVVITDGDDNSSRLTLKQAIAKAQRGEVAVYTVNSRDGNIQDPTAVGDHALRTLSELTGGTAFKPGSIQRLSRSMADLQQVIRGRYLVSYKPASFERDDRYRTIDIAAQKDGRKLTVFARKGYYASAAAPVLPDH
jgi:VWFA-related protein